MLKIEDELTLEDEINSVYTAREYIAHLPLLFWQNSYVSPYRQNNLTLN